MIEGMVGGLILLCVAVAAFSVGATAGARAERRKHEGWLHTSGCFLCREAYALRHATGQDDEDGGA